MTRLGDWVLLQNLTPLIDEISALAGEQLDHGLRKVFVDEVNTSDADASPPRWAECQFDGPNPITAYLGVDQGTDNLQVRLDLPAELEAAAGATLRLMQRYVLLPPHDLP
ncbi:hypothetical protein [Mesorhizobium sp. NPDC059025]|uniref:hypothetical protein n=1 Tax=unclassified Mesorhizobium TaxID=325217 RepID=UPI0036A3426F